MTFVLTGLDIEAKADLVRAQLEAGLPASRPSWPGRWPAPTARTPTPRRRPARCCAAWRATPIPNTVGPRVHRRRRRAGAGLLSRLHLTAPPGDGARTASSPPAYVDADQVAARRRPADGTRIDDRRPPRRTLALDAGRAQSPCPNRCPPARTRRAPLGTVAGARSGDKGGDANVGVWVRTDGAEPGAGSPTR